MPSTRTRESTDYLNNQVPGLEKMMDEVVAGTYITPERQEALIEWQLRGYDSIFLKTSPVLTRLMGKERLEDRKEALKNLEQSIKNFKNWEGSPEQEAYDKGVAIAVAWKGLSIFWAAAMVYGIYTAYRFF